MGVTVLVPSKEIAARWEGALEARLRQAPLEKFLRARGQKCTPSGRARVTDNLVNAAIYFGENAIRSAPLNEPSRASLASYYAGIGDVACAASLGVAALILEPTSWRIAGLVATARLLAPYMGLDTAAHAAAGAARRYSRSLTGGFVDGQLTEIRETVSAAIRTGDPAAHDLAIRLMAHRLTFPGARPGVTADRQGALTLKSSATPG